MTQQNTIETNYKTPWFTWFITLISLLIFILINIQTDFKEIDLATYKAFGAPAAVDIYQGQYWGVVFNSFVHAYSTQFILNIIGIWILGAFVERRIGLFHFVLFGLFTSIITSIFQLALSTDAGLGLTGVNYALFGYIFVRSQNEEEFKLKRRNFIFFFMIGLLTYSYYLNFIYKGIIATEAMLSGLISGVIIAVTIKYLRSSRYIALFFFFLAFSGFSLVYAPWSSEWHVAKGIQFHEKKQYKLAKKHYLIALKLLPHNKLAKENIEVMEIDKLCDKAYHFHALKKYNTARKFYKLILKKDPTNDWAKENLNELP